MKQLSGKVAVITGAGSGIGKALALKMAEAGSRVALIDINEGYLREVFDEIQHNGRQASMHVTDIACRESVEKMVAEVNNMYGQVDILVNNAGVSLARMALQEISWEQWDWIMKVNFWGTLHCTKLFYPLLSERPEAHIVNVSSVFSLGGVAERSAYCASKFAVRGLTEAMIQETKDTSISVTSVLPGGVSSNIVQHCAGIEDEQLKKVLMDRHRRSAFTSPEKAAKIIINGIKRKKRRVLIGSDAYFMDFFIRFFRRYMAWGLDLLVVRPEKKRIKKALESSKA